MDEGNGHAAADSFCGVPLVAWPLGPCCKATALEALLALEPRGEKQASSARVGNLSQGPLKHFGGLAAGNQVLAVDDDGRNRMDAV